MKHLAVVVRSNSMMVVSLESKIIHKPMYLAKVSSQQSGKAREQQSQTRQCFGAYIGEVVFGGGFQSGPDSSADDAAQTSRVRGLRY